jgi:benzoyl-CoA reductase/2-hydroxyglutaryl-CoA dehydratase subunit BcrC/BadD/HgdB
LAKGTTLIDLIPPVRMNYLKSQKYQLGRRLVGVFPADYPREILWSANALPVEIWDPPLEVTNANAHLQAYICSIVKVGLELILRGKCDILDAFLFPHTCDSIQNLASIVNDYLGVQKPCFFFYHPKAPYEKSSHQYYRAQLEEFSRKLEREFGPIDPSELKHSVEKGQEISQILNKLYAARAAGSLGVSNQEFYQIIRQGEYLHPDDYFPRLEQFLCASGGNPAKGIPLLLSGILPHPGEILTLLDQCEARVADDDLLNCGRRLLVPDCNASDPFEILAVRYFSMPPCTTRNCSVKQRTGYLIEKAERCGARGIIFNLVKFCEPEFFDLPQLLEALREKGLHSLVLDSELNQGLTGQLKTRIEAFVEMIAGS